MTPRNLVRRVAPLVAVLASAAGLGLAQAPPEGNVDKPRATLTVADSGRTEPVEVRIGERIAVRLPYRSNGYLFVPITALPSALQEVGSKVEKVGNPPLGAEGEQVTTYKVVAASPEPVFLELVYARPFAKPKKWDVVIGKDQRPWDKEFQAKIVAFRVPLRVAP